MTAGVCLREQKRPKKKLQEKSSVESSWYGVVDGGDRYLAPVGEVSIDDVERWFLG